MDNLITFVTDKQIFLPFSTMALSRTARSYNKISTIYEEMMALYIVEIFMYTLINFIKKYNRSIIVVTHDRTIADYADRIIFLTDGLISGEIINTNKTPKGTRK